MTAVFSLPDYIYIGVTRMVPKVFNDAFNIFRVYIIATFISLK